MTKILREGETPVAEPTKPKSTSPQGPLDEGDWIEVSVSHQVKIDREESWIKAGAGSKVRPGETASEAYDRVSELVNHKVIEVIEKAVEVVRSQG